MIRERHMVSVMMPVYNGLPMIKASVTSLLNQTYTDWECIIVDDGSTDGTSEFLDTLTDSRFKVVHLHNNSGRAIARQTALDSAHGEFIAMLDADDLYHPDKLKRQVDFLINHPEISLVSSAICSFGTASDLKYKRQIQTYGCQIIEYKKVLPSHACSMLRMEYARKCFYKPYLKLAEDVDFLDQYLKGRSYAVISDILYYYSEIDSVTKDKLIHYYTNGIQAGLLNIIQGLRLFISNGVKFIVGKISYPFINMETILKKRGTVLSKEELEYFNNSIQPIIDNVVGKNQKHS